MVGIGTRLGLCKINEGFYRQKVLGVQNASLIQALLLNETSGTTAEDSSTYNNYGDYAASGITYANNIGPFRTLAPAFDGNNTYVNIDSSHGDVDFDTDWDGNLYSAIVWGRVDAAARWVDSSTYRYLWHIRDGLDATYYTTMGKTSANNQVQWRRRTGGAITSLTHTFTTPPTDWFCMGITFDLTDPLLVAYLWDSTNSFQVIDSSSSANLTDWGNHPPTGGTSLLMAGSLTLQEWIGWGAQAYTWKTELTQSEMQKVMTP